MCGAVESYEVVIRYVIHGKQRHPIFVLGTNSVNNSADFSIAFQICCRIFHLEDTSKPGGVGIEWDTSASSYAEDITSTGESIQRIPWSNCP
jgi:hypothetical protein